eukprot:1392621-Amorphochlora_amoeboformis.AAC.1
MTSPANPTQYQTPDKLKSKKKARKGPDNQKDFRILLPFFGSPLQPSNCETESPRSKNGSSAMLRNLRRLGSTVKVRKIGASLRRGTSVGHLPYTRTLSLRRLKTVLTFKRHRACESVTEDMQDLFQLPADFTYKDEQDVIGSSLFFRVRRRVGKDKHSGFVRRFMAARHPPNEEVLEAKQVEPPERPRGQVITTNMHYSYFFECEMGRKRS